MARLFRTSVLVIAAAFAIAGCASVVPPVVRTTVAAKPALTVTLTRTGGFSGSRDRVVIGPDGSWTRTDKAGNVTRGQLTADRIAQLQNLATEPALAAETAPPTGGMTCADGFDYAVHVGTVNVTYTDCGDSRPPVAGQMASLIAGWILN